MVRPAVFLDRDGVITESEIRDGKPYAPRRLADFRILPEAPMAVAALAKAGYAIVVVTNQPDVGNGLVPKSEVEAMHARLAAALPIDRIKACYHAQAAACSCRKPKPGMLLEAASELALDLAASTMVGDRWSDVAAGKAAGCRTVFIDRGYRERRPDAADWIVSHLAEAASVILQNPPAPAGTPA